MAAKPGTVPLGRTRTVLLLYAILVVLPTGVFGGLHWHQLLSTHERELNGLPSQAREAAGRLEQALIEKVEGLLAAESARPFYKYREIYWPPSLSDVYSEVRSELAERPPREGLLVHFNYDQDEGEDALFDFLAGRKAGEAWEIEKQYYRQVLRGFITSWARRIQSVTELGGMLQGEPTAQDIEVLQVPTQRLLVPVSTVALNLSDPDQSDCFQDALALLDNSAPDDMEYVLHDFQIYVFRDEEGRRQVIAQRLVEIKNTLGNALIHECFERLEYGTNLVQGFLLDPDYLHLHLPSEVAADVLGSSGQTLVLGPEADREPTSDQFQVSFDLTEKLPIRLLGDAQSEGLRIGVRVDGRGVRAAFKRQSLWFLGVAAMMVVSLAVGMGLLVHSVSASLERARRTENFVAAVTHELRTPIAAVKMYGEMLREGWVTSPEKQRDYLERIVRETNRLDGLVDRVLEKRKLGAGTPDPLPGDLTAEVESMIPDLVLTAGTFGEDLDFQLAPDLPEVLLLPEAVRAVVQNLVENARKYAPVGTGPGIESERIAVTTRLHKGRVLLEVSDRGPGIPDAERTRIFDAFYRLGDERTRTRPGTGLGLHIVWLQVQAMRAKIDVLSREGGGTTFRIAFRKA